MANKGTSKGGNLAVVLTEFNQDDPTAGLQVVERDIPKPKAGEMLGKFVQTPALAPFPLPVLSWSE